MRKNVPRWFTPNVDSKPSLVVFLDVVQTPALFTRMSRRSWAAWNFRTNSRIESLLARSSARTSTFTWGARVRMSAAAASPFCTSRAAMTTVAPRSARPRAVSLPMPVLPPVTMATFPDSCALIRGT